MRATRASVGEVSVGEEGGRSEGRRARREEGERGLEEPVREGGGAISIGIEEREVSTGMYAQKERRWTDLRRNYGKGKMGVKREEGTKVRSEGGGEEIAR